MTVDERIKKKRLEMNLTLEDLSKKASVSRQTIFRYENGEIKNIPSDKIELIAQGLGTSPSVLMGWEQPDPPARNLILPNAKTVPILGRISCGNGTFINEESEGMFTLDYSIKADYCLIASGDSMADAGIQDGDRIFLSHNYEFTDGKIYGVVLKGEDIAVLKMVSKINDKYLLQPCNSSGSYKPILVDPEEICIVGQCVGIYKSL